jgi:GT2 family glycosyltransferase
LSPQGPSASIAIPTRARVGYLDATLASIAPQAEQLGAEVVVISDGPDPDTASVAQARGARVVTLPAPAGLNAARNAAIEAAGSDLIVFADDDVSAPDGWLAAMLAGARDNPDVDVFGGPIRALLEGGGPRACGREPAPISTLDLGADDRDAEYVWGANMAVRRRAFERVGTFDEALAGRGDEEEWERRHRAAGGRIRYLAAAGLDHRRTAEDATVIRLSRAAYALGRTARRNDVRKNAAPPLRGELRTLAGCCWHVVRRRCAIGIVMAAHAAGRLREAIAPGAHGEPGEPGGAAAADFLSGASGQVHGVRRSLAASASDALGDAYALATLRPLTLRRAAARLPPRRRVLVLAIERTGMPNVLADAREELGRSRHELTFISSDAGERGKFENLNALLAREPAVRYDWLLALDDDVELPRGFLDEFLFLSERFGLSLAQPAHRHRSHAAWDVTRRRATTVVRETAFVEIGPVFAFHREVFEALLPFPELRIGWGLDLHWSAVALERGWRLGVVDATPVRHGLRRTASAYDRNAAIEEARLFLASRPYTRATDAQRSGTPHRSFR